MIEQDDDDDEDAFFFDNDVFDDDDDDDNDNLISLVEKQNSFKQKLNEFNKIASIGQIFLKYTGQRRRKPQDRIIKVTFDHQTHKKPLILSWGGGSRHIEFKDILYVIQGLKTPTFKARYCVP